MAFEISNAVKTPVVASYSSVEKVSVPTEQKTVESSSEGQSSLASSVQVKPTEKKYEENLSGNSSDQGNADREMPTEKQVSSRIEQANNKLRMAKTGLDFKYHEATKRVSITVYDKDTKEIIREIPPEKSLDMLEKMWELAGMVVDDRR